MTTGILGIKPRYDGLEISPCIPDEWPGFKATRRFRNCQFDIEVTRGARAELVLNGKTIEGGFLPASAFEKTNVVSVRLGPRE